MEQEKSEMSLADNFQDCEGEFEREISSVEYSKFSSESVSEPTFVGLG